MVAKRSIRLRLEGLGTRVVPAVDVVTPKDDPDSGVVTTVEDPTTETPPDEVELDGGGVDGEIIYTATGETTSAAVDLDLKATVDKAAPGLNDVITVSIAVTNKGDLLSTGAAVSVTVPAGLTLVKALPPTGTTYDATAGTWAPGLLGPTEVQTLQLQFKVTDTAAMAVGAALGSADQADPVSANNSAGVAVAPVLAKLTLTQTATTARPAVGSWVVFTTTVRNSGPGNGTGIRVAETFAEGLAGVRVAGASQGSYNPTTKVWHVGMVKAGTTATLRLVAQVTRTGALAADAAMIANGMDEARSTVAAGATLTGARENKPANWVYLSGPNFQTGKTPAPVKPVVKGPVAAPAGPIAGVVNTPQAQAAARMLVAKGFVFKGMDATT